MRPLLLCALAAAAGAADREIGVGAARIALAIEDGRVLGLAGATVGGVVLRDADVLRIPLIAEPWGPRPRVVHRMVLTGLDRAGDGSVSATLALSATRDPRAVAALFWTSADGGILRDFYAAAHWRIPAEAARRDRVRALAALPADLEDAGTLVLRFAPRREVVEGWTWDGWEESWRLELRGWEVADVGWLGSWELGGTAAGLTVVNHRYRGLGGLEQVLAAGPDGTVAVPFTTTEILPGAAGAPPVVSPAIPASATPADRGWSLAHRASAWINRMARGAGVQAFDFQYRDGAGLFAYPVRQGDLRAMTECHPGDRALSHSDEERGSLAATHAGTAMRRLVLAAPLDRAAWRSRWQAADRHVRALHAAELGMVQPVAEPSIGLYQITNMGPNLATAAAWVERWAGQGVRHLVIHQPFWVNGRSLRDGQEPGTDTRGGGDCSIHEWRPLADTVAPWRDLRAAAQRSGIGLWAWMTAMSRREGRFVQGLGEDPARWAVNDPGRARSSGYDGHWNHDPIDPAFAAAFFPAIERVRREQGFDGVWADSFQNLWMTSRDGMGRWTPFQRAWWERIAAWSRDGVAWMAESTASPGLSCSVEVGDGRYEDQWWFLPFTVRWYRCDDLPGPGTAVADRLAFRIMANGGWAAPMANRHWFRPSGIEPVDPVAMIPGFARFAAALAAARPWMRVSEVLPGEGGVLWWADDPRDGVWFSFADQAPPPGVALHGFDGAPARRAGLHTAWRVRAAAGLAAAFGRPTPP